MYDNEKINERKSYEAKLLNETAKAFYTMAGDNSFSNTEHSASGYAIRYVLSKFGLKCEEIPESFSSDSELEGFLVETGIIYRKVSLKERWWKDTDGTYLIRDRKGDWSVFTPVIFGYREQVPGIRNGVRLKASRASELSSYGYCLCRPFPQRRLSMRQLDKFIISELESGDIVRIVLLCLLVIVLGTLVPFANKEIFEFVIPSGKASGVLPIFGLLLGAGFSIALYQLSQNLILLRLKDKINFRVQTAVIARLLSLPLSFFKKSSSAEISTRALSVNNMSKALTDQVLCTTITALLSFTYIFIIAFFAPELTWFVTLAVIVYFILVYFRIKANFKRFNEVIPQKATIQGFLFNGISGIHKLKNNGAELRFFTQWAKKFSKSEQISGDASFFLKNERAFGALFTYSFPLIAWFEAYRAGLSTSNAIAFMSAFGIMMTGMDKFMMMIMELVEVGSKINLLKPILEEEPEDSAQKPVVTNFTGALEFNDVSFRYSETLPPVLERVSFKIEAGQNVGIVGASGCGKSTLIRLIAGMEQVTSGSIFFDQYDICKISSKSLRQFVGYCPQNILIFPDTIMNNIRISKPSATDEEVWEAARVAALDDDIKNMPYGMNTVLGEGGKGLSGGQCQRILIARAILNKPNLLLFDEATSALDNITQKKVTDNLARLRCTRISIAHRLSTLEHCDRILVLNKGKLVEDGSPSELMKLHGYYYQLSKRQTL